MFACRSLLSTPSAIVSVHELVAQAEPLSASGRVGSQAGSCIDVLACQAMHGRRWGAADC